MLSAQKTLMNLGYQVFMVGISMLAVINAGVMLLLNSQPTVGTLALVDALLTPFFLFDFGLRMVAAPSKWRYFFLKFGWADLLGSLWLPGMDALRIFRLYRIVTIVRQMPTTDGGHFWGTFRRNLANSVLGTMSLVAILVLELAGIGVLHFESASTSANITTPGDALWWGIVTIATVGYGDKYPLTPGGRMVGTVAIVTGVAIFSTISGYLANAFVNSRRKEGEESEAADAASSQAILAEVQQLAAAQELRDAALESRLVTAQDHRTVELEARLARIEALLAAQTRLDKA